MDSVLPRLNSASVINKTTVEVSFSEEVVSAELPEHYLIAPSLGNFLTAKKDSRTYQLIFTQSIAYNTLFTVKALGITDLAGNAVDTGHDTAQFQRQAVERIYIYHNNKRIAMEENGVKYFYLHDHLGSTNVVTDENGKQVEHYEYTAYGDTQIEEGSLDVAKKFTGKELDDSTGLYDYGARMYDPKIGRFITADTIGSDLTNPQSLNRYSYCLNNPLKYVDPSGKWQVPAILLLIWAGIDFSTDATSYIHDCVEYGRNPSFRNKVNVGISLWCLLSGTAANSLVVKGGLNLVEKAGDAIGVTKLLDGANEKLRILNKVGKRGNIVSKATKESGKTITVIGSLKDTGKYIGKKGFNVLEEALQGKPWTKEANIKWLDNALNMLDEFWIVTNPKKHKELMERLGKKSQFLDLEIPYIKKKTGISIMDKFK